MIAQDDLLLYVDGIMGMWYEDLWKGLIMVLG
jgi:hypothetical protein